MPLILVSAEKTCAFNNNKLFKRFKEKLAVTPGAITCIPALVHEKMEIVTPIPGCCLYFLPQKASEIPMAGGPRGGNFQGGGVRFSRSFFPGTLKQKLLFLLMILH